MERKLSRRGLIKIGIATVGISSLVFALEDSLLAHAGAPSLTLPFWEKLETDSFNKNPEVLTNSIEQQFGIKILPEDTIDEMYRLFPDVRKYTPEEISYIYYLRTNWDLPRLVCLYQTLDSVPPNFYEPEILGSKTNPLSFSLFSRFGSNRGESGVYQNFLTPEVRLISTRLPQTLPVQTASRKIIVHELTHHLTFSVANNPDSPLRGATNRLMTTVGLRNIKDLRSAFKSVIIENHTDKASDKLISWTTHLGYGASNFAEFWAVAAETYYDGRDIFEQSYARFLGNETAKDFYFGMKEELFTKYEYQHGTRIV